MIYTSSADFERMNTRSKFDLPLRGDSGKTSEKMRHSTKR